MSRNGLFQLSNDNGLFSSACFAIAVSLRSFSGVFLGIFMSLWAVCFSSLFLSICSASKCKSLLKNAPFLIHYFSVRKSFFRSFYDSVLLHAAFFSKINGKIFHSLNKNFYRASAVFLLIAFGRPFAIIGRIPFIIVNPIYRVSNWALSHIGDKVSKAFAMLFPSFTNKNSSASVVFVGLARCLIASGNHTFPDGVKRMLVFKRHVQV